MRRTQGQLRIIALLGAAALALTGLQVFAPAPAQAADAREFNASNIISDINFYNGSAMSASEIQAFLNAKVPRCTIGDPGREPGSAWGSTRIASHCLKDFAMPTVSKAANAYCAAYAGSAGESAAQIINKAARACGISQKVLLVMLEKEQSLISDTWPTVRQFDVAMGYACPDSGPNNSANCDANYFGFQNQVYRSAWQLKVYKAHPTSFNYQPFQTNTIQWHPNTGCGTSQVYISNWATAALYIYTPYRPNAAALNAQWGTGDACSTYGNRNFFMFYSTWFGSPTGATYPQIDAVYAKNSWLGAPTSDYSVKTSPSPGVVRSYENGAITWKQGTSSAFVLSGDFRNYYGSQGGLTGRLGWPTSNRADRDRGSTQAFEGGAVSWMSSTGYVTLRGKIRSHYAEWALAYSGPLGWPLSDQTCTSSDQCTQRFEQGSIALKSGVASISIPAIDAVAQANAASLGSVTQTPRGQAAGGGGFVQAHQNGAIAWSAAGGAHSISGAIRKAYGDAGGVNGLYGWPLGDQTCDSAGVCSQRFTGGTIQVDASGRTSLMSQEIKDAYDALRAAGTDLGKSLGDTRVVAEGRGGLVHAFEKGAIAASTRTGAFGLIAPIREPYNRAGGLTGPLGWPTGNARQEPANGGGIVQGFEGGAIANSPAGSYVLAGAMRQAFGEYGGLSGELGWPQSDQVQHTVSGGGIVQAFQGGALVQPRGNASPILLSGEFRRVFGEAGGLAGTPGWPIANRRAEPANGGGEVQAFQNAAIASSPAGTFLVSGEIRTHYNALGGLTGELGWPVSTATASGTEYRQSFQGGTIIWDSQTGVARVEKL